MTKCGTIIIPDHVCSSCGCELVYRADVESWYCENCESWGRRRMKRYRNNFERIFKFYAPRGFYAEMSRAINVHYVILYKYLRGHTPKSMQRASDICTYLQGATSYNVQPETLWPDRFGVVADDTGQCINEALVQPDIMDTIESIYGKDSMQSVIAEEHIDGATYEQISQKIGRTRERIRQVLNKIIERLKTDSEPST